MSASDSREQRRILAIAHHDRESETRTPSQGLFRIPEHARDTFNATPPTPQFRIGGEADMTRISPGRPQADGEVITVGGRLLDERLNPVRGSLLEVWNCNTYGRYSHSDDHGSAEARLDPNFYGFGRVMTDDDGRYLIRTIKPSCYLARADIGWWRPPHVHFSVVGGCSRLVTQMYFPDDPLNVKDHIYMTIPEDERDRTVARFETRSGSPDAHFEYDIVVRGRYQTPPDID